MPLHHDQCVARAVLGATYQGSCGAAARAADREPGALPERVERQAAVLSEHATVERFDRPGRALQVAAQEIARTAARR